MAYRAPPDYTIGELKRSDNMMNKKQKLIIVTILYCSLIGLVLIKYHDRQRRNEIGAGELRGKINESILLNVIKTVDAKVERK